MVGLLLYIKRVGISVAKQRGLVVSNAPWITLAVPLNLLLGEARADAPYEVAGHPDLPAPVFGLRQREELEELLG